MCICLFIFFIRSLGDKIGISKSRSHLSHLSASGFKYFHLHLLITHTSLAGCCTLISSMATILANVLLVFIFLLSVSMCSGNIFLIHHLFLITIKIHALVYSYLVVADAQFEDYCIADEQYMEDELKGAMKWACSHGADCSAIEAYKPCFFPNTTLDHASYAFNSYYQNMKHNGGTCYFIAASVLTALNPSKKFFILQNIYDQKN